MSNFQRYPRLLQDNTQKLHKNNTNTKTTALQKLKTTALYIQKGVYKGVKLHFALFNSKRD